MSHPAAIEQEFEIDDNDLLVLLGDRASNILYVNPAYTKASGYTLQELRGTVAAKMMDPRQPMQVSGDMGYTIGKSGAPWTGVIRNRAKDGRYYWLRLNISPVFVKGKFAGSLMVHSKPTKAEVEAIRPLYVAMRDPKNKTLMLRHGRVFRANAWGKLMLAARESGLRGRIWATTGVMGVAAAGATLALGGATGTAWIAAGATLGAAALAGLFLVRSIVHPLRGAMRYANLIAGGDLSAQPTSQRSDEIGGIVRALGQMNINMRATVTDVREGLEVMRQATGEIAAGTQDLSARTETQASNLQETAASMEEMTATVQTNTDTARRASSVASTAFSAAEAGGQVVRQVISTMDEISHASRQIAEIIGVIDSIAFQTNILALNAAVEAARAGEQGRGFAVVAGEVRTLAQRSAQSAKEIRALISNSVSKVTDGAKLVNNAGKTIDDIVQEVRSVSELVSNIAHATVEQSLGIGQVNQAVAHLDNMTQQNAALAEQSTASAESLRQQAERVTEAIGVFKLSVKEIDEQYRKLDTATAKRQLKEAGFKA
ncbi:MAG: PAS domain S-box protein [Burkholderiales bacterium]|nr:PAS domain S-box protein [Burkholderiales bacterium]